MNNNVLNLRPASVATEVAAREYVANGWALVPIPQGTKGPRTAGWNRLENCISSIDQCSRVRANVGLAHLYSRTCVLDFDNLDKAIAWLRERGVDFAEIWEQEDAVRISSGRPNRGKLLFRLPPEVDSLPSHNLQEHGIELRCATSTGLTAQDVLPPSVHPETGLPYVWEYADDEVGDWRSPPELPSKVLALWRSLSSKADKAEPTAPVEKEPLGLSRNEARKLLSQLDHDMPFPDWINVGFALHHEFRGGRIGFDLWDEWSAGAVKYQGSQDLAKHWATFGRTVGPQVTARSLMRQAGIASVNDFDAMTIEAPAESATNLKFSITPAGSFTAVRSPGWVIKDMLPKAELAVVYGESGAGKSFVLIDMMCAIARGAPWRGLRVKQGRVVYVCAEGVGGFRKRLSAYGMYHGVDLDEIPLGIISDVPNLLQHDDKTIAKQVEAWGGADVIVFDTFAQSTPGANENASDGMGTALAHCKRLHKATGAMVVLVAHTGKDPSKGMRGWSGIKGATDVQIEVVRSGADRAIRTDKQKDEKDGGELGFRLRTVVVYQDEDGDDVTSCVIEHTAAVPKNQRKKEPKGDKQKLVMRMARELVESGEGRRLAVDSLIEACVDQVPRDPQAKCDNRRRDFMRAIEALVAANQVSLSDFLCETGS